MPHYEVPVRVTYNYRLTVESDTPSHAMNAVDDMTWQDALESARVSSVDMEVIDAWLIREEPS